MNFDPLWTLILIGAALVAQKRTYGYLFLGLVIGFVLHFYAGSRAMIVIILMYLFISGLPPRKKDVGKHMILFGQNLLLLITGMIIALGPTLHYFTPHTTFEVSGAAKTVFIQESFVSLGLLQKLSYLVSKYELAFAVYVFNPTLQFFHFPYATPLLAFPSNWFFLAGLCLLIKYKELASRYKLLLVLTVFIFPFFNQVLLGEIGDDHRIQGILPIAIIISSFGIWELYSLVPKYRVKRDLLVLGLLSFLTISLGFYFLARPSDLTVDQAGTREYRFQAALEYIRDQTSSQTIYLVNEGQGLFDFNLLLLHYQEKIRFYTYPREIYILSRAEILEQINTDTLKSDSLILSFSNWNWPHMPTKEIVVSCAPKLLPVYHCPRNSYQDYSFFVSYSPTL